MAQFGWLHISEVLELNYLEAEEKYRLKEFINKKMFRVADTPLTYRQVNVLDRDGLLGEETQQVTGTWREFSPKELIYILVVTELKKFGLEHKKLRPMWQAFFKEPDKPPKGQSMPKPHINRGIAETAIGCVFGQVEMTLVVSSEGEIAFFDPGNYATYDRLLGLLPDAYIKLTLNDFVNEMLKMMKKEPFPIKWSISEEYIKSRLLNLSDKEKGILEVIRNNDFQTVKLKKKNDYRDYPYTEKQNNNFFKTTKNTHVMLGVFVW